MWSLTAKIAIPLFYPDDNAFPLIHQAHDVSLENAESPLAA
jgi:hypothetical protein